MSNKTKISDPSSAGNVYLIFYNVFLTLGWLIVLIQTTHHLIYEGGNLKGLWESTSSVLMIAQTLAVLEVSQCFICTCLPSGIRFLATHKRRGNKKIWDCL
ncbi:hypothetical protein OTU49_014465 [Cherax quadricarinatus]|uniref:Very-long-chain (3R)-3-hydroxyacyl-CoA dehydratase n=1 Tax=Cherax quadricarinatus TaxID=27406 RepID=A0AAW0VPP6_CHEQU